ncbi:MAG TPA: DUF423 domain-containing protein [Bacteroidetes bacterium]|nr:DUF423 domain-containing protein [Bacteroidota bacterium]
MSALQNRMILGSGILLAAAVGLGAFGAHALKGRIDEADILIYKTANHYHFIHALGILILASFVKKVHSQPLKWGALFLFAGIVLFSGSLYALALSKAIIGERLDFLGMVPPFGGLAFIIGWLIPALSVRKKLNSNYKPDQT